MRCPQCAFDNPSTAKFCQECGAALTRVEGGQESRLRAMQAFLPEALAEKIRKGKGRIEGERRFVTVVFADVSGFTAMSELLDPEEVTNLMNDCFKGLVEVIYQYEGMVDKFIGDCVMAIFGAPVTHEDDPVRAVRSALEMMEAVRGFNQRKGLSPGLSLHTGINSGWVIAGSVGSDLRMDYTVMGDTVNLASRLESAAERGQIFISQRTASLVTGLFDLQEVEPLSLKGKREPVAAYEVLGSKTLAQPQRGLAVRSEMVGRDRELGFLKEKLREVRESKKGKVIFITGEAGIGKTRLFEELAKEAQERGFRCLRGRCLSHGQSISYWPFMDLLRDAFGLSDLEKPEVMRDKIKGEVRDLFPERLEEVYPYVLTLLSLEVEEEYQVKVAHLDAQALRLAQFCALMDLFLAWSKGRPLLVAFEDWHWADASSADLFEFLAESAQEAPMALCGVMRPEEESFGWKALLSARNRGEDLACLVSLKRLGKEDAQRMIANLLGSLPGPLPKAILAKSIGNPFYVEEIIRSLVDSGVLRVQDGAFVLADPEKTLSGIEVPDRVEMLIASRIDRLAAEAREVLQAASVIGLSFYEKVLAAVTELGRKLDSQLALLESRDYISKLTTDNQRLTTEVEFIFKHPLIQEVAYNELLKKKRKEFHRRVGECIEGLFAGRLEEFYGHLAHHYACAEDWEKALGYSLKAGQRAKDRYANEEAIRHYERAASIIQGELKGHQTEICIAYEALGDIHGLRGEYEPAIKSFEEMFQNAEGDPLRQAKSRRKIADVYDDQGRYEESLNLLAEAEKGLAGCSGEELLERAEQCFSKSTAYKQRGDYGEAIRACEQGLHGVEEAFRDPSLRGDEKRGKRLKARIFNNLGSIFYRKDEYEKAIAIFQKGLALFEEIGEKRGIASVSCNLGIIYGDLADQDKAIELYRKYLTLSEEIGYLKGAAIANGNLGVVYEERGDYDRARECYRKYAAVSEKIGDRYGVGMAHYHFGILFLLMSEFDKAKGNLLKSEEILGGLGEKDVLRDIYTRLSESEMALAGPAGRQAEAALEYMGKAMKLADELDSQHGRAGCSVTYGKLYSALGDFKCAEEHFRKAIEIYEKLSLNLYLADACLEYARMLRKGAEKGLYPPSLAEDHLARARRIYEELKLPHKVKECV